MQLPLRGSDMLFRVSLFRAWFMPPLHTSNFSDLFSTRVFSLKGTLYGLVIMNKATPWLGPKCLTDTANM